MTVNRAEAHASLTKASPAPNASLAESPPEIRLTFDERLEREQFRIRIFDDEGKPLTGAQTEMSLDQREISLSLPAGLREGVYTVSYHIISEDGHPVRDTYVWSIGQPVRQDGDHPEGEGKRQEQTTHPVYLLFRVWFDLFFLLTVGGMLWGLLLPVAKGGSALFYRKWFLAAAALNVFFYCAYVISGLLLLLEEVSLSSISGVLTGTVAGRAWCAGLLLSVLGFAVVRSGSATVRALWILLMLAAKAFSGHAYAGTPVPWLAVPLDMLHVASSALWASGIVMIAVFWRRRREEMIPHLRLISRWALISIVLLAATGLIMTDMLLERLGEVLHTVWGTLLMTKTGLTAGVVLVAAFLRRHLKRQAYPSFRSLLNLDLSLMLAIVAVAGVFSFYTPRPQASPLQWSVPSGSVQISPNSPGTNEFVFSKSGEASEPEIKEVRMVLVPKNHDEIAPIEVKLEPVSGSEWKAAGAYLAFPGRWTVQLRITDRQENEQVYRHDWTVYGEMRTRP